MATITLNHDYDYTRIFKVAEWKRHYDSSVIISRSLREREFLLGFIRFSEDTIAFMDTYGLVVNENFFIKWDCSWSDPNMKTQVILKCEITLPDDLALIFKLQLI